MSYRVTAWGRILTVVGNENDALQICVALQELVKIPCSVEKTDEPVPYVFKGRALKSLMDLLSSLSQPSEETGTTD